MTANRSSPNITVKICTKQRKAGSESRSDKWEWGSMIDWDGEVVDVEMVGVEMGSVKMGNVHPSWTMPASASVHFLTTPSAQNG